MSVFAKSPILLNRRFLPHFNCSHTVEIEWEFKYVFFSSQMLTLLYFSSQNWNIPDYLDLSKYYFGDIPFVLRFLGPPPFPLNLRKCGSLDRAPSITIRCLTAIWRPSSRYPHVVCSVCLSSPCGSWTGEVAPASHLPALPHFGLSFPTLATALRHDVTFA